jgi:hypothetical protein
MGRYILRYRGTGSVPAEDLARIHGSGRLTVIESSGRMLLVDAPAGELESLANSMSDWTLSEERTVSRPDPRPKLRRPPKPGR